MGSIHGKLKTQSSPAIQENFRSEVDEKIVTSFLNYHPQFLNKFVRNCITIKRLKHWQNYKLFDKSEDTEPYDVDDVRLFYHFNAFLRILPFPYKADKELIPYIIERSYQFHQNPPVDLDDFMFDHSSVLYDEIPALVQYMYENLFGIDSSIQYHLTHFLLEVKTNYIDVAYHNAFHAFNHVHSTYVILKRSPNIFREHEKKALMIAAFCHDLGHPGIREDYLFSFLEKIKHQTPVLENHHKQGCFLLLMDKENNIFKNISDEEFLQVIQDIEMCIYATYPRNYNAHLKSIATLISKGCDFSHVEFRNTAKCLLIIVSDFCSVWKRWDNHLQQVETLLIELDNGEKLANTLKIANSKEPKVQMVEIRSWEVSFIENIVYPIFNKAVVIFPCIQEIIENTEKNLFIWKSKLVEQQNG